MRQLQGKIAKSSLTLPVTTLFAVVTWLVAGVIEEQWWLQLACFMVSAALMAELNNGNALIRVRSRMVVCTFLALSCAACFLFGSLQGAFVQLCSIASYHFLFRSYQNKEAVGLTYYAFLCMGLASLSLVEVAVFIPFVWLFMATNLLSLSWRTWLASLLGFLTPYWFTIPYLIYQQNYTLLTTHFTELNGFGFPFDYSTLTIGQVAVFAFILLLTAIGSLHFWRFSYEDSIRVRLLYGCFITMNSLNLLLIALQPQYFNVLMPLSIVNASPIIAHFFALTNSRVTNIMFFVAVALTIAITVFNLWMPSLTF